jgi:ferric-dicitrate binding protein FerR (iron transport regulator)
MPGIIHRTGKLQFGIATTPATPLRIKTPFLMAAIADATFTITVKQGKVALYVVKGAARVMSVLTGEEAMLQPHQLAWVSAPSGGRLKTIMMRPRTAPRVGGNLQARLAISQPTR